MNFETALCFMSIWRDWSSHHVRSLAEICAVLLGLLLGLAGASQKDVYMDVEKREKRSKSISDLLALDREKQSAIVTDFTNYTKFITRL